MEKEYVPYLIYGNEIDRLARGELKPEDVKILEKVLITTWTGEDVQTYLKEHKKKIGRKQFKEIVDFVHNRMGDCNCGECVDLVISGVLNEK